MRYGNCLLGLLYIMVAHRFRGHIIVRWSRHCWAPHLLYKTAKGLSHFRTVRDLLPWPFSPLWFEGRIESTESTV